MSSTSFVELLGPAIGSALEAKGFTELTPVQQAVLDVPSDKDLRITSQTGSGKTIAIGIVLRELLQPLLLAYLVRQEVLVVVLHGLAVRASPGVVDEKVGGLLVLQGLLLALHVFQGSLLVDLVSQIADEVLLAETLALQAAGLVVPVGHLSADLLVLGLLVLALNSLAVELVLALVVDGILVGLELFELASSLVLDLLAQVIVHSAGELHVLLLLVPRVADLVLRHVLVRAAVANQVLGVRNLRVADLLVNGAAARYAIFADDDNRLLVLGDHSDLVVAQVVDDFLTAVGDSAERLAVVGAGMRTSAGVSAQLFRALSDAGINIEMISTSEIRISVVTRADMLNEAMRVVHTAFGLDGETEAVVHGGTGR